MALPLMRLLVNADKASKSKAILSAIVLYLIILLPMAKFVDFPIIPDEISFRLLSGRWLTEDLRATGIHWICHPTGVKLEYFFLPAAIILQAINGLLESTNFQRQFAAISMSFAITITLSAIARIRGIRITTLLPIGVLYMGLIPVFLILQRPEQLWIFAALGLLSSISIKARQHKTGFLLASFIFYYVGFFVHVEFLLLLPAILVAGWQILKSRLKKITWIVLGILTAIAGRAQFANASSCLAYPSYNEFLNSVFNPKLNSLDSFWNDFWKSLVIGGNFSTIHIAPPLPELSIIIDFQKAGFGFILITMIYATFVSIQTLWPSSNTRLYANKKLAWISTIANNPSLTGVFILIASLSMIAFDPLHQFYRNTGALIVGSLAIAQQPKTTSIILTNKNYIYILLKTVAILLVIGSSLSSMLMWSTLSNKIEAGYVGPSLSKKDWESTNKRPLNTNVISYFGSNPSEVIIIDDSTYNIAKDNYRHLVPITYLALAMQNGAYIDLGKHTTFKSIPAIVTCVGNEEILRSLGVVIEKRYKDLNLGRDICMGKLNTGQTTK
jgi:hypothetical protein